MNKFKLLVVALMLIVYLPIFGANIYTQNPNTKDSVVIIEKVYLHSDRNTYFAGDDVWFKAYLIDAFNHKLTDHSNNLHVELISPASKIILNRTIRLEDGMGNGDFKLPGDIKSGSYKIRAYTNYMRNFSDQLFFNKEIDIINSSDSTKSIDDVNYVGNQIHLSFFPEGGSLVDNVSSIVAFKATNSLGKCCDVIGKIYSSQGDLITTFKSAHHGMGKFFLKPFPGLQYYSIAKGSDSIEIRTELPASFPAGVVLSATIDQNNELIFNTRTNPETLALISDNNLLLSFSVRNEIFKTIAYKIKSPVTSFMIPTGDLPEGILQVTLSAAEDLPLSERLVYIQKANPVKIQIETDKQIYGMREPVSLRLSMSEDSAISRECNISLAVVNENLTDNTSLFPRSISSWFLLESDVRGAVEDPSYYFDPSNPSRLSDLDLLLRTQGWRDFAWKYDTTYFPPENGFSISGSLRKFNSSKLLDGSRVSIGIFGSKNCILTTIPVDSTGRFKLSGIDLIGEAKIVASGIDQKDRMKGALLLDSVDYIPAKVFDEHAGISILADINQSKLRSYYSFNESIRRRYKLTDTINIGEVKVIAEKPKDPQKLKIETSRLKYIVPEAEVIFTDQMVHYMCPVEILKGRVAGLVILGGYPKYSMFIRGTSTLTGSTLPLVLVDGHESSFDELINMPINFIDRIDVLKSGGACAIFGLRGSNGVINIITKIGDEVIKSASVTCSANNRFSGYDVPRIFYSPTHLTNSASEYIPDLRSTLYWKPDITLVDSNNVILNYYNADNSSLIKIIAEGITTTGIPVTGQSTYEIK